MASRPSKTRGSLSVLKSQLKEFCSSTSAHGLGHAASSKSVVGMVFWTVIFLAAFVFVMWQTYILLVQFQSHPTNTKVKIEFQRGLDFPVVLICNHNKVKHSHINNVFQGNTNFNWTETNDMDQDPHEDILDSSNVMEHISNIDITTMRESGHSLDETVHYCKWNDKKDCIGGEMRKYWKWSWHWMYGNCYSFNTGTTDDGEKLKILSVDYPGPKKGLKLTLNVNQEEYIGSMTSEAGIRVFIGNQGELASPYNEGFSLAPGAYYYVPMRKTLMERADPFHNESCRSESDDTTGIFEGVDTYNVRSCMYRCLALMQQKECNCTEYWLPHNGRICSTERDDECADKVNDAYQNGTLPCLNCPPPCKEVLFSYTMSSTLYPSDKRLQKLIADGIPNAMESATNVLKANFFYERLDLHTITETENYSLASFMGDFGGLLGLWTGISCLTAVEFFAFVGCCLFSLIVGKRSTSDRRNGGDKDTASG